VWIELESNALPSACRTTYGEHRASIRTVRTHHCLLSHQPPAIQLIHAVTRSHQSPPSEALQASHLTPNLKPELLFGSYGSPRNSKLEHFLRRNFEQIALQVCLQTNGKVRAQRLPRGRNKSLRRSTKYPISRYLRFICPNSNSKSKSSFLINASTLVQAPVMAKRAVNLTSISLSDPDKAKWIRRCLPAAVQDSKPTNPG
jgi:hypothetical protein